MAFYPHLFKWSGGFIVDLHVFHKLLFSCEFLLGFFGGILAFCVVFFIKFFQLPWDGFHKYTDILVFC
ncbi:MAG: hypothetical protein DRJ31_06045 [Candidatus Methanomethylicota archaeon]|uniref:Uncharacterized protein n=1 Tax=Thermoproteota archaeon TaxID=2056631 RepID=A0A497EP22_9CREN|nr:MAG: hypothetical protein DRJ31_06045 [Candidatus Verstraetearchaeota archaeon]RLE52721.1 MAG: hypothetical protein DRJ33_03015 [Candidatus Verstraetearchaeota archaeon]